MWIVNKFVTNSKLARLNFPDLVDFVKQNLSNLKTYLLQYVSGIDHCRPHPVLSEALLNVVSASRRTPSTSWRCLPYGPAWVSGRRESSPWPALHKPHRSCRNPTCGQFYDQIQVSLVIRGSYVPSFWTKDNFLSANNNGYLFLTLPFY